MLPLPVLGREGLVFEAHGWRTVLPSRRVDGSCDGFEEPSVALEVEQFVGDSVVDWSENLFLVGNFGTMTGLRAFEDRFAEVALMVQVRPQCTLYGS